MVEGRQVQGECADVRAATGDVSRPGGLALTDHALATCALPPGARVLDLGCGTGATVRHLVSAHALTALGIDLSPDMARSEAPGRPGWPLLRAGAEQLPLRDACMDAVLAECTLSLCPDLGAALAECHRVLVPCGYLIVSDLCVRAADGVVGLGTLPAGSCLRGALPAEEIRATVEGHGFTIRLWQDHEGALRRLAAQVIWTHGSLAELWCRASPGARAAEVNDAISAARPSYFLLVAQKARVNHG